MVCLLWYACLSSSKAVKAISPLGTTGLAMRDDHEWHLSALFLALCLQHCVSVVSRTRQEHPRKATMKSPSRTPEQPPARHTSIILGSWAPRPILHTMEVPFPVGRQSLGVRSPVSHTVIWENLLVQSPSKNAEIC